MLLGRTTLRQKRTFAETGNDRLSLSEEARPVIKSRRYLLTGRRRFGRRRRPILCRSGRLAASAARRRSHLMFWLSRLQTSYS